MKLICKLLHGCFIKYSLKLSKIAHTEPEETNSVLKFSERPTPESTDSKRPTPSQVIPSPVVTTNFIRYILMFLLYAIARTPANRHV